MTEDTGRPAARKPMRTAVEARQRGQLPLVPVRQQIWAQACELVQSGDTRDLCALLANRFHTSERIIQTVLVLQGIQHERAAATLRNGIRNTLSLEREAVRSVEEDISNVA